MGLKVTQNWKNLQLLLPIREPFTDQLGYLVLFSVVDFLKKQHGVQKVIEVYKKLDDDASLEEAYLRGKFR